MPEQKWPTLERLALAELSLKIVYENAETFAVSRQDAEKLLCAASWAVRVRPQLEALVDEFGSDGCCFAGDCNHQYQHQCEQHALKEYEGLVRKLEALIATPHEAHKETQG